MITNENEYYINEDDLSKDGTLLLPTNDVSKMQTWYEDNDFVVNTSGIFTKSYDDDGDAILTAIHDFPICIYKVLEKNAQSEVDNNDSFTTSDTKQFVMVKYKVAGTQKNSEGVAFSRFKTSIMPTNESLNMSSNGGKYDPIHLSNGWTAPTLRKNKVQITTLLQRMLDRCTLRAAYDKTGWQYDNVDKKLYHITPSHNYYIGKKGYSYIAKAGSREKYISAQNKTMINSPMYALIYNATQSAFLRGLIPAETVSHAITLYGKAGEGKSTIIQFAMSFFGSYSSKSRNSNTPNMIDGSSSLAGTEFLISARNNSVLGIDEFDAFVRALKLDSVLLFLNGGGRIVKNQEVGGVNILTWDSLFLTTANDQPTKIYPSDGKNEAFSTRVLELNILDPVITKPENGKDGYDIHECEHILYNNYGHGYDMLMEYLENEEKREFLIKTFHKTFADYKKDQKLASVLGTGNTRLLYLFSYLTVGALILKDLYSEEAASQATYALNQYIKSLSKPDNIRNPRTKAIETIKLLKHSIVMFPRAFVWDTYAFDRNNHENENLSEREIKERQIKKANLYNDTTQKIGIIKQDRPFKNQYDFDGELLLNVNTKNTSTINIGNTSIPVNEIISAVKELSLCYEAKNGNYTKQKLTKKATKKERSYFDDIPSDVLRIKLKPLAELELENDLEEFENSDVLNSEIEEISKVAKRENTTKGNKNKEVADIFSDMLSVLDKGKGSDLLNVVDMSKAKRITKEEFSVIFPEAK